MKRHHEGDVAQEVAGFDDAGGALPTKRPRSSPQLPLPPPPPPTAAAAAAAPTGGGPITVWQPSPFAVAKASSSSANGVEDVEGDPMEAEEEGDEGFCPLLGRRRSASLPPLATVAPGFLSPRPFFATTPLPLPLPLPPTPVPQVDDNSMAIVLYRPSAAEVAQRRLASASPIEEEKERRRKKRAVQSNGGGFERIEEEGEEEGDTEAMMN